MARKQAADQLHGKVGRVLGMKVDTRAREGLTDAELKSYLMDDKDLLWLEWESVGVLTRNRWYSLSRAVYCRT